MWHEDRRGPELEGDAPRREALVNRLPWAVWLLLALVLGVEAVVMAAAQGIGFGPEGIGLRIWLMERFSFAAELQDWMLQNRTASARHLWRYVSYPFVQAAPLGALLVAAMIAALGKRIGEARGSGLVLALGFAVPALAAFGFGLITGADPQAWLSGGMVIAFAMVGAVTWLSYHAAEGDPQKRRRAFALIGSLMLLRLGMGLMVDIGPSWIADLLAFGFGFAAAALFDPEGRARIWRRLRTRG